MDDSMLGKLFRLIMTVPEDTLGILVDLLKKITGKNRDRYVAELRRFLRKETCWTTDPKPASMILEFVSTAVVSATTGKFVAKDKFVVNTKPNAPVKIINLGDNFTSWFLSDDGKIEDPIVGTTLRYHKLRQYSVNDCPIIAELGGEKKSETTLTEMFSLMEKQKHGEGGVLLNDGWANIFYIKDNTGVLRSVLVFWFAGGWCVDASSIEITDGWDIGGLVFSRVA